jgi:hypothetical protein
VRLSLAGHQTCLLVGGQLQGGGMEGLARQGVPVSWPSVGLCACEAVSARDFIDLVILHGRPLLMVYTPARLAVAQVVL